MVLLTASAHRSLSPGHKRHLEIFAPRGGDSHRVIRAAVCASYTPERTVVQKPVPCPLARVAKR